MKPERVRILLVEDDEVDVIGIRRAFDKNGIDCELHVARDGVEALDLMRHADSELRWPYIVLLDLNMPRMSGQEFLAAVREDDELSHVIIFVLSTSDSPRDIELAYSKNVAGYVVKSSLDDDMGELVRLLEPYWRMVEFPRS